jgi:lipoprotein-anchoring transpeptidase ErfK/SrfK
MARVPITAVIALVVIALGGHLEAGAAAGEAHPQGVSSVTALQARLAALGYLAPAGVSGRMDESTRQAVLAFQGWEGLGRDGVVGPATRARLVWARRPGAGSGRGSRIEINVARQVALLVRGARVVRAIHVSTGASGTPTPTGRFRVYRKERESWSAPFRVWLPWASYFSGGVALHGYPDVPPYAASHGCVRIPLSEAQTVYAFARLGISVDVDSG